MCSECLMSICPPGCPNYESTSRVVGTCAHCKESILTGEEYAEIGGAMYHTECLEEFSIKELLQLLDVDTRTEYDD